MKKTFYITTPIYYVNASPHIGHSYTNIAADVLARFYRQRGRQVYFLTGTDEHGQKIVKAATQQKLEPLDFTNKIVMTFRNLWQHLDIQYDDFIRTTEKRHFDTVRHALEVLHTKGDIIQSEYAGWYCVPCESFWTEEQLQDTKCPDCHRPVEHIKESNYFFRLSRYQRWLIDYIKAHPRFILPPSRYNEVLRFLESNELRDLCISRPRERLSWGIPTPFSDEHVTYVWFDALINYISAIAYARDDALFNKWWPVDVHLIGKDILRQHAIYWPIMLHALGIPPPEMIFAHGWWLTETKGAAQKMSKSKGNIVNPLDVVDVYGVDAYRYFLLREVPFGLDGTFSEDLFIKRYNADLANDLGNLAYRTLAMIEKYIDGRTPKETGASSDIMGLLSRLPECVDEVMADLRFSEALIAIWEPIKAANKFVEDTKPWQLYKAGKQEELEGFLFVLLSVLRIVARELAPFMPQAAARIQQQIHAPRIAKTDPIFPRIDVS